MIFRIFLRFFLKYIWLIRHILFSQLVLVIFSALAMAFVESISLADSLYLSFITAFTIGYGDIAPVTITGRVLSIFIGLLGIIFTGLVVAVSTRALVSTLEEEKKMKS